MKKYKENLAKTLELIQTCFTLKHAYLTNKFPKADPHEIKNMIYKEILLRKERQWKSEKVSLQL